MTMPSSDRVDLAFGGRSEPREHGPEDRQGQSSPRLTEGRRREATADKVGQVCQRRVPVDHLDEEDLQDREGVEDAGPPAVPEPPTVGEDGVAVEVAGKVVAERLKNR